jgi:tetratricopeptide (TPR) repeat protein
LYDGYLVPEPVMFAGLDAVLKHYEAILGRVGAPDEVPEAVLNSFGYLMLGRETDEAVRAFELATRLYPQSANAWDSLSDGYLEAGRDKEALSATDKSIEAAKSDNSDNLKYFENKRTEILGRM